MSDNTPAISWEKSKGCGGNTIHRAISPDGYILAVAQSYGRKWWIWLPAIGGGRNLGEDYKTLREAKQATERHFSQASEPLGRVP